ncbi:hypothetical protein PU629_10570 [Pullulanibacillus sp. KACC 23026]|uniref:hypothetical protein n=1 Tax=Pullulanibacillus sp. KACC 23026 TaxID=3028315 RepID=UPI0023B0C7F8|nr:hypothetical protein [Pullulanibacillus sp. KACC 23026]WEG14756.1 hypothetical protein PU629_10570 [Pullulanibacillus sp. KACC 23026]
MAKSKNKTNYTPDQLGQLSGEYKDSDNTMSIETSGTKQVNKGEGDGISTKRPQ